MKRTEFLRSLGLIGAAMTLPEIPCIKQYDKYYLLQCFVAGFKFYNGPGLLGKMKAGSMLELVREPQNEFDNCAVALHFNRHKIGFIPSSENEMFSRLLDIGTPELMAEITHIEAEAATWENVALAIFVLKESRSKATLPRHIAELTILETPRYYSLKGKNDDNTVIRIYADDTQNATRPYEAANDWYNILTDTSVDDGIFDLIHQSLNPSANYNADKKHFTIAHLDRLPGGMDIETFMAPLSEMEIVPANDDFLVLHTEKLPQLMPMVKQLAHYEDEYGDCFVELVF